MIEKSFFVSERGKFFSIKIKLHLDKNGKNVIKKHLLLEILF